MKKKKLFIFDIDGTLTKSVKIHQKAFTEMLTEIGIQNINTEFKSFKHHTDSFIVKKIYEDDKNEIIPDSKIMEFEKGLTKKISSENIKEIKGAKKLIEHILTNTDNRICYATGSLLRPAKFKLQSIGINYNEKLLVASDNIYERENIVSKAIERAKEVYRVKEFDRIISIGDGLWDLITAKNLNLEFVGIGLANKKILEENGANLIFKDLTEFKIA